MEIAFVHKVISIIQTIVVKFAHFIVKNVFMTLVCLRLRFAHNVI